MSLNRFDDLFYISGSQSTAIKQPGNMFHLKLTLKGLLLFQSVGIHAAFTKRKDFIAWEKVIGVETVHNVGNSSFSAGGAIAGEIMLGTLGAIAGGLSGGKKVDSLVIIRYKSDAGDVKDLVISARNAEKIKDKVIKQLQKRKIKLQPVEIDQDKSLKNNYADEIEKLAILKEKGVLTQQEFEAKKKQLLGI